MLSFADYQNKPLHEIVFPGSHDSGITEGGINVKTQTLSVLGPRTNAGCRYFDIRIKEHDVGIGRSKQTHYDTYHAKFFPGTGATKRPVKLGGVYGSWLDTVLSDCSTFAANPLNATEFLIFARLFEMRGLDRDCQQVHTAAWHSPLQGSGRFEHQDTRTDSATGANHHSLRRQGGEGYFGYAFPFGHRHTLCKSTFQGGRQNCYRGPHTPDYDGLQYFGKFGETTSAGKYLSKTKAQDTKIKENVKKQIKYLSKGTAAPPQVLGMMYWTTTGIRDTIDRNNRMWQGVRSDPRQKFGIMVFMGSLNQRAERLVQHLPGLTGANAQANDVKGVDPKYRDD